MARIALTSGYSRIPEGHYTFTITKVDYNEAFGDMSVTMKTDDGYTHKEIYKFLTSTGEPNDGAMNAFSYMAKAALNDMTLDEIDEEDILGCTFEADVEHTSVKSNRTGKTVTYAHVGNITPVDTIPSKPATKPTQPARTTDLASLL